MLYALLSGGDYSPGITGCGPIIALALSRCFGDILLSAVENLDIDDHKADKAFANLRDQICNELETNSRGFLGFCHPAVAKGFPETFPDRNILKLYCKPTISTSSRELVNSVGPSGNWPFREPSIAGIAQFGRENFGWKGETKLKEGMGRMWEGILSQMLYSVRHSSYTLLSHSTNAYLKPLVTYDASKKCIMTPSRQSSILDARLLKQQGYLGKGLHCPRISASIVNFVRLVDPGYAIDNLEPVKLWVPNSLLPEGLAVQGRLRRKKRATKALMVGGEKRRKVANKESSTEYLEQPESSSMGSTRGHLDCGQVRLNDSEGTPNQVVSRLFLDVEGGDKIRANPWSGRELVDLTGEDGAGLVPRFGGEVIDLTEEPSEEGEDKLETLVVGMGVRSATPWVDGDYIDLTI